MKQEVTNFARFYAAFNRLPCCGEREEMKRSLVMQYTCNRTDSLREMTRLEYSSCCNALEKMTGYKDELRMARSSALKLMQRMGVDTSDWTRVNALCLNSRIAGKEFIRLSIPELQQLQRKLRMIANNGGLRKRADRLNTEPAEPSFMCLMPGVGRNDN